jgi:hypothetical protein
MGKVLAFVVVTAVVVALAGPLPTIVNGILVLIISGMILLHPDVFTGPMQQATGALQ